MLLACFSALVALTRTVLQDVQDRGVPPALLKQIVSSEGPVEVNFSKQVKQCEVQ